MEQQSLLDWTPPVDIKGSTFDAALDGNRLAAQSERVWAVVRDGQWWAYHEIAAITHDPEPSISARLRDIRRWLKPQGGDVLRRRRDGAGLNEYRVVSFGVKQ